MAASGKKNKKNKWKTVELNTVLAATQPVTAWADEVEIDERELQIAAARKSALPTAPRSARGTDDERVPNAPPYVAYITNIPFELIEEDIAEFFADMAIESIRLPRNDSTGKLKGYGYVEFTERQGLLEALQISDTSMKGRRIRIDVSENNDRDRGFGSRMGRDRMGMGLGRDSYDDPERTSGDWRSAPRVEPAGEDRTRSGGRSGYGSSGFGDREGRERDGGGFGAPRDTEIREGGWREGMGSGTSSSSGFGDRDRDRDSFRSRGFGDRDRDGFGDRDRGGRFGDREGGGGGGFSDRPRYGGDRDGDRFSDRPRYGGERDRDEDRERFARRDDGPPSESSGEQRARPKLNLQPRTRPVEAPAVPPELVREREIEEREEEDKKKKAAEAPPVPRPSIFGAAKPVDTTAREREIEERLVRERGPAPKREERDRSSDNQKSKESNDDGDESGKKVEAAPPPKENAWSRRPRIEPNNGESSPHDDDEGDQRATSPGSYEEKGERQSRPEVRQDQNSSRSQSHGSDKGRDNSADKQVEKDDDNSSNRSGSRNARDHDDQDLSGKDDESSADRPSRRDHSNDEPPRLPKYEEQPIPNFVASNKFAYLNEDGDHED